MIDQAFYVIDPNMTVARIADACGGQLRNDDDASSPVRSVSSMASAASGDLTFCEKDKPQPPEDLEQGICLTTPQLAPRFRDEVCVIIHAQPRWAFARASSALASPREDWCGPNHVDARADVPASVKVGPGAVIAADARIGANCRIFPGAFIGPGVTIGRNSTIGPNASVRFARIGDDVVIGAGTVIGEIGFGLSVGPGGAVDTPHFGRVIIQDHVSIGANVCVDRGLLQDTEIGQNAKIDNLCQIAHNVKIGAHAVIAALCGIAGSSVIGEGAMFGGMAGVSDHIAVGARARLAGGSSTMHDIPAGETWAGFPAKSIRTWMRDVTWLAQESQKRNKS